MQGSAFLLVLAAGQSVELKEVLKWPEYAAAASPLPTIDPKTRRMWVERARRLASRMAALAAPDWGIIDEDWIEQESTAPDHVGLALPRSDLGRAGGASFSANGGEVRPKSFGLTGASSSWPAVTQTEAWTKKAVEFYREILNRPVGAAPSVVAESTSVRLSWTRAWNGHPLPYRFGDYFFAGASGITWNFGPEEAAIESALAHLERFQLRVAERQATAVAARNFVQARPRAGEAPEEYRLEPARLELWDFDETWPPWWIRLNRGLFRDDALIQELRRRGPVVPLWRIHVRPKKDPLRYGELLVDAESGRLVLFVDSRMPW
jgi:hypothetical protein